MNDDQKTHEFTDAHEPLRRPEDVARTDAKLHRTMVWILGFVVIASGLAFVYKLYEFFHDLTNSDGLRFAGTHLLTYCLVAGGFLLLLLYAFLKGHFSDIERPKYELLDWEDRHDRATGGRV